MKKLKFAFWGGQMKWKKMIEKIAERQKALTDVWNEQKRFAGSRRFSEIKIKIFERGELR